MCRGRGVVHPSQPVVHFAPFSATGSGLFVPVLFPRRQRLHCALPLLPARPGRVAAALRLAQEVLQGHGHLSGYLRRYVRGDLHLSCHPHLLGLHGLQHRALLSHLPLLPSSLPPPLLPVCTGRPGPHLSCPPPCWREGGTWVAPIRTVDGRSPGGNTPFRLVCISSPTECSQDACLACPSA